MVWLYPRSGVCAMMQGLTEEQFDDDGLVWSDNLTTTLICIRLTKLGESMVVTSFYLFHSLYDLFLESWYDQLLEPTGMCSVNNTDKNKYQIL